MYKIKVRATKGWTTHMPLLIELVQATKGPVLELGSGLFSTPLLHWFCEKNKRKLVTYEDQKKYYFFARKFKDEFHTVRFVRNWDNLETKDKEHWSVVFVDHAVKRRHIEAIKFKNHADFIILHDTQHASYRYDLVWPHFKYVYHWKKCVPWTSVASNFKKYPLGKKKPV